MKQTIIIAVFTLLMVSAKAQWAITGITDADIQTVEGSGSFVFAGSSSGGAWRSADDGTSWTNVKTGLINPNVRCFAFTAGFTYAGTQGGVFVSTDNGDHWSALNAGLTDQDVYALAVSGNSVFAGTNMGVFVRTNSTSWSAVTSLPLDRVYQIAVYGPTVYVVLENEGLHVSQNAATFSEVGLSHEYPTCVLKYNNTLLAGSSVHGVFSSTDGGVSWSVNNSGLPNEPSIRTLFAAQAYIFTAEQNGKVYASKNGGSTWYSYNDGLTHFDAQRFTWNGSYVFLANRGSGVWRRPISDGVSIGLREFGNDTYAGVYPNPTNKVLTVQAGKNNSENKTITLYDSKGGVVLTKDFTDTTFTLDIKDLAAGLYFYKINTLDEVLAQGRVVKE